MVFPIGAQIWELAADHLDRLPGKSLIDGLIHKRSVAEDDHAASTDQPQRRGQRRCDDSYRDRNAVQRRVELRGCEALLAELQVAAVEFANDIVPADNEHDVEEQIEVGEQRIDGEHDKHGRVVAGEVAQVVVDTRLHLAKVGRLRDALEVEELADGAEVGESRGDGSRPEAGEPVSQVKARRQSVQRDLYACHVG